jgi:hypothetical protein
MPSRIVAVSLLSILAGCDSIKKSADYNFEAFEISDKELVGRTFAECENARYKGQYEKKKAELKKIYDEFTELYKKTQTASNSDIAMERLQKIAEQESEFERFIESYAEKNAFLYCRSGYYHYYGALMDMLDLRIKHFKIHIGQL